MQHSHMCQLRKSSALLCDEKFRFAELWMSMQEILDFKAQDTHTEDL